MLSSPNGAIIVQRMVHWQTGKSSAPSEINAESDAPEAEVSRDSTIPKRVDSLWKVGANVSGGVKKNRMENTVTNAVSIGSVNASMVPLIKHLTWLLIFIRANSFAIFLRPSPYRWKIPSLAQSISEFKERMKQYGYANNLVMPISKHHHLGNPDRFVSAAPVYALVVLTRRFSPVRTGKNPMNVYWMTCSCVGLELYNIWYSLFFFFFF